MTKQTRYFVMGSGAILVLGLTTGLLASYVGLQVPVFSRAAGPEELQFVPSDAAMVAYANVRTIVDSQFHQRFRSLEPDSQERDSFEAKTGVNLERDVDSVVAAMLARPNGAQADADQSMLIIARGRFEPARLESLAIEHGGLVEDYQGKRLLSHGQDRHMTLGFIDADVVAMGASAAVKSAIDANRAGRTLTSNTQIMRQVAELEGNSAWAVGQFDAVARGAKLPSQMQAQVPQVTWFSAAAQVDGGLNGTLKAEARDEEAAQNLRDMLRGFMAMAKLHAGNRAEMKPMVEALQLGGEGKTVQVQFSLPADMLNVLQSHVRKQRGAEQ